MIGDILNDLESLTALFREYDKIKQQGLMPTIPKDCFKKVVYEKLDRIREDTKEL